MAGSDNDRIAKREGRNSLGGRLNLHARLTMTDAQEPVAWAVVNPSGGTRFLGVKKEDAQKEATASERVAPVYWPALTDDEREAVGRAARFVEELAHPETSLTAATLRGLLKRIT